MMWMGTVLFPFANPQKDLKQGRRKSALVKGKLER
jgi:hypothetical protein